MAAALTLSGVSRHFRNGEETISALANIDLEIKSGEMIAIVGPSGSGKSTLMNIIGCLDQPDAGRYLVDGVDVANLNSNGLANLRRRHFGFVFQRYHLVPTATALANVELPSMYTGMPFVERSARARALIERLGLEGKLLSRPYQLSGGQQQRIAIARALMNGGDIVLADEPTGALDRSSGEAVIGLFQELHREGRTVVIVTHDQNVAHHAERIITMADGRIVSDTRHKGQDVASETKSNIAQRIHNELNPAISNVLDAFKGSLRTISTQRLRTALTMTGIVVGIAAVVAVVGLGEGAKARVLAQIDNLGTDTISVFAGRSISDPQKNKITTLTSRDASALSLQPYVGSSSPEIVNKTEARFGSKVVTVDVSGVASSYFSINGMTPASGRTLSDHDIASALPNVVLSNSAAEALFGADNPLGKSVVIANMTANIVGVLKPSQSDGRSLLLYMGYTTLQERVLGNAAALTRIVVRVANNVDPIVAERTIVDLLLKRHGAKDFFTLNEDQLRHAAQHTLSTFNLMIVSLAATALFVGGIGVMNIMLISVTERTNEIGIRMAMGARQSDIAVQFIIEALVVCSIGGTIGILAAVVIAALVNMASLPFQMMINYQAVELAVVSTLLIGLVFGFLPARIAAQLDPVKALTRS